MPQHTKNTTCDAYKAFRSWQRAAVQTLHERGVDIGPTLNAAQQRRLESMLIARAHVESCDKPKIHFDCAYPMEMFLLAIGGPQHDSFERSLPRFVEVSKLYIPFVDGSVMMVQAPSERTVQCGLLVGLLLSDDKLAEVMGADHHTLEALKQVVDVAKMQRIAPISKGDLERMMTHEAEAGRRGFGPSVRINFAKDSVDGADAIDQLRAFLSAPRDSLGSAVEARLARELASKQ